jgi:hypothetical protein
LGPFESVTVARLAWAWREGALGRVVNELVEAAGPETLVAEYECAGFLVQLKQEATGGLLNKLEVAKMLTSTVNTYTATNGEEKPSDYEETGGVETPAGLEQSFAKGPFEEFGITLKRTQTSEEAIEVNNEV